MEKLKHNLAQPLTGVCLNGGWRVVNWTFYLASTFEVHWQFCALKPIRTQRSKPFGNMLKEPTYIQAHLVFANLRSPNKKPKEL